MLLRLLLFLLLGLGLKPTQLWISSEEEERGEGDEALKCPGMESETFMCH